MIDKQFFSQIRGAVFKIEGSESTGPLYHWMWYGKNISGRVGKLLTSKGFVKNGTVTSRRTNAEGEFTRAETNADSDHDKIMFHVEYFDGKGNNTCQEYIKPNIEKKINTLTWISIVGSIASIIGVVLGILSLCK